MTLFVVQFTGDGRRRLLGEYLDEAEADALAHAGRRRGAVVTNALGAVVGGGERRRKRRKRPAKRLTGVAG